MLLELALATAIQHANPHLPLQTSRRWAHLVAQESEEKGLDPWMFFAIVQQESRWTPLVLHRYRGGRWCDVGLGQVHIRCTAKMVLPLLNPEANLRRSAQIQKQAMDWCHQNVCEKSWVFLYNHSSDYVLQVNLKAQEARDEYTERTRQPPR